jgi:hypothetical protein
MVTIRCAKFIKQLVNGKWLAQTFLFNVVTLIITIK